MMVGLLDKVYIIGVGMLALGASIASGCYLPNSWNWTALSGRVLLCLGFVAVILTINAALMQIGRKSFLGSSVSILAFFIPFISAAIAFIASHLLRKRTEYSWKQ